MDFSEIRCNFIFVSLYAFLMIDFNKAFSYFQNLTMMCLDVLFLFPVWCSWWCEALGLMFFIRFGKILAITYSNIILYHSLSPGFFFFLIILHRLLIFNSVATPTFFLRASVWIICIGLASDILVLSFAMSNMLLSPLK